MSQAFICVGDKTDHGGTVITGNATFDLHGKKLAQVGDLTTCPKCKGVFPITTGTSNFVVGGKQAAIHGSKTACGATVLSSQLTTDCEAGAGPTHAAGTATAAVASAAPTICLECLMHAAESGASTLVRT